MIIKDERGLQNLIEGICRQAVKDYKAAPKVSYEKKEIERFFTSGESWFGLLNIDGDYILKRLDSPITHLPAGGCWI